MGWGNTFKTLRVLMLPGIISDGSVEILLTMLIKDKREWE